MLRSAFKSLALFAVVGVFLGAQQAQAGVFHRGGGSSGGSNGSWGSSGGSWGSSGGSSGSSGGSWGSSGGSWGSSGGSWGSCGGSSSAATPLTTEPELVNQQPKSTDHPTYGPLRNDALLSVKVPTDAKVFVNDHATRSTGADREYISRNLKGGAQYNYAVRVEFIRNGQTVSENKTVQLTAGQSANLDFTQGEALVQTAASPENHTALIGQVPVDAKLYLVGREMKIRGPACELSNGDLTAGSPGPNDAIQAVIENDGQVREQTGSLTAYESRDDTRQAVAGIRSNRPEAPTLNRRADSSNWLATLSLGGAAFGFFAWRKRQAGREVALRIVKGLRSVAVHLIAT